MLDPSREGNEGPGAGLGAGRPSAGARPNPATRAAPPSTRRTLLVWSHRVVLGAGFLLLGVCGAAYLDAFVYQTLEMVRLVRALSAIAAAFPGDRGSREASSDTPSSSLGRIEISRIGISAIIAEGCEPRTLRRAVGHVPGSAMPGESGNICLAGHRDTFFRRLSDLQEGDVVRITTLDGAFDYVVDSIAVVDASRTDVLDATRSSTLTLITCYPFCFAGPAPARFVARAERIGTPSAALCAVPLPGGRERP